MSHFDVHLPLLITKNFDFCDGVGWRVVVWGGLAVNTMSNINLSCNELEFGLVYDKIT